MGRSSVMRLYGVVGAAMVLTTAGCTCQPAQDECDTITAVFASPVDGATVNPTLDLEFRANNNVGNGAALSSATIAVKPDGAAAFGAEKDASIAFNKASLTGLVLAPGKNQIRATLNTSSPVCVGKTATITVTARSTSVAPKVSAVSFPQDLNGDLVLNATELPMGTTLKMEVTATDTTASTVVRALSGMTAVSVADVSFSGGKATVEIPVLSNSGKFDLFAQLASAGVAINTPIDNPEALGSITVERNSPNCALTTKDTLGPTDDALAGEPTFGLRATGTVSVGTVTSTLQLDTATPVSVTAVNSNVSTDFAVPQTGDTTYTVKLVATDALGNVCTATKLVRVDLQAPVVTLNVPLAADGGTTISTTPIDVTVSATGAADGDDACLYRQQGAAERQLIGCEALVSGSAVIEASFATDGVYTLIAEVQDSAGNLGSTSKSVNVALTVCGLSFATIGGRPAQCPAFVTQLTSGAFGVTLTTGASCAGAPISLSLDTVLVGTNATGVFSVPVTNGTHQLQGKIPTSTGSTEFTTVSCEVEVNTNAAPVFVNPSATAVVTLNQALDLQPLNAGAQYPLQFTAMVPNTGRVEVCANTNNAAIVGVNATACSDGATGWFVYQGKTSVTSPDAAFTYAEGSYLLHLVLVGPGGATATSADLSLVVDVTAPCVSSAGVVLPQDVNSNNQLNAAEVGSAAPAVTFSTDPLCGAAVSAQVKSATSAVVYSAVIPNPVNPVAVNLTGTGTTAALDVFIELTDAVGNKSVATTTSGRRAFSIDLDVPVVTLTIPLSADGGMTDITTTPVNVTVAATGVPDGTNACLYRQQGVTPRQLVGCEPLATGAATVSASFGVDGTYTLIAEVSDAAANVGSASKVVNVTLSVCGLSFATIAGRPAQCPAFITTLTNGQFAASLTTGPSCQGSPISIVLDSTVLETNTTGNFAVPVTNGLHTLEGRIPTFTGSPTFTTVSCDIEVNTNAFPVFTNPPAAVTATFSQSTDRAPGTAGAQWDLAFSASVPVGGRVEVCANTNDPAIVGASAAACADGATGWFVYRGNTNVTSPNSSFTYAEGSYKLRLVVVSSGGVTAASQTDLTVIVDVTAPCVAAAGVTLPQDANTDNRLNAAELGVAAPQLSFGVDPACGAAVSAQIRSASSSTNYSALVASPGASNTVDLTGVANTASLDVFVVLRDAVGNSTTAASPFGRKAFNVDRDAPTCTIRSPATTTLNIASLQGLPLAVEVETSADVITVPVKLGAGAPVNAPVSSPTYVASTSFMISGTQSGQVLLATCTDSSGNQSTGSVTLSWDLDAPTCGFTLPAANSTSTSNDILTTVSVTGAEGRTVHINASAQVPEVGTLTVVSGVASGPVNGYPNGLNQTLTATVSDSANNPCVTTVTGININSASCNLNTDAYVNGATLWINAAAATGSGNPRTTNINVTTSCLSRPITLTRTAPTNQLLDTVNSGALGSATFTAASVSDGDTLKVEIDNGAGVLTAKTITVDFTLPTVGSVTIGGAGVPASNLFFVAPGTGTSAQNRQVQLGTAGYYPDTNGSTAGAQTTLAINTVGGGTQLGAKGSVNAFFKSVAQFTPSPALEVSSEGQSFTGLALSLPQNDSGSFVVRVTDQAGNNADVVSQTAAIDVIPPAQPGVVRRALTDARAAKIAISWDAVGDDDLTGTVRDYDVRWTTSSVNANNALAAEADFFGTSSKPLTAIPPAAGRLSTEFEVPALNTYYVAVRARDEVDNYSAYDAPKVGGPDAGTIDNFWTRITLTGTAATNFGSSVMARGSLNNDGITDLVVAASNSTIPGAVNVYYGSSTMTDQSGCVSPACTAIAPPTTGGALTNNGFGSDVSMHGNVGDAAAENKPDLLVGQLSFSTTGRALIYFGVNTATVDPANFIEIRGSASPAIRIGYTTKIISDIDGDGLDEVIIPAPFFAGPAGTNQGRIYIFKGRSLAAWQALRTLTDATTSAPYAPITSADWIIDGPDPRVITTTGYFGRSRNGIVSLGDLDGDLKNDFTVGLGPSTVNQLRVYKTSATGPIPFLPNPIISQTAEAVGSAIDGFGAFALSGYNFLPGAANDLVVTWPARNNVYLYADPGLLGVPTSATKLIAGASVSSFGTGISAGNLNTDDTDTDLVVGGGGSNVANGYINAWVVWNRAGTFDSPVDPSVGAAPKFWVSTFNLTGTAANSLGKANATSDLNGDNKPDLVLADDTNNVVYIWR